MLELIKAIRILGLGPLLRMGRAHRYVWGSVLTGFYSTRVIQVLHNVGVFDEMERKGKVNPAEFARANSLDGTLLQVLFTYMDGAGIFKKNGSSYTLDRKGALIRHGYGWFEATYGYRDIYYNLEEMLKKEKEYGSEIRRDPVLIASGSGKMEQSVYYPLVIDMLVKNGRKHVLDLGCGECTFLRDLCKADPSARAYGLDLSPEAISLAGERIEQAGLKDRILVECRDITKMNKAPEGWTRIDGATCFFVLHEILYGGRKRVIEFLQGYQRIFPGAPLLVVEVIRGSLEQTRKSRGMGAPYYLQHDLTHQRLETREGWRTLFREAGFTTIKERYLKFAKSSIFTLA